LSSFRRWAAFVLAVMGFLGVAAAPTAAAPAARTAPAPTTAAAARTAAADTAFRVVTYNVCGSYVGNCSYQTTGRPDSQQWAARLKSQILTEDGRQPDVIMFQEMCATQREVVREAMPGYGVAWVPFFTHGLCPRWDRGYTAADYNEFGTAIFIKGAAADLPEQVETLTPIAAAGAQVRKLLCTSGVVGGRDTLVCNVHTAGEIADAGAPQMMAAINRFAQGRPVLFGGDLNADPFDPNLNAYYGIEGGFGPFTEVDQANRRFFDPRCARLTLCRSGDMTTEGAEPRKFDYLFGTAGRISWTGSRAITPAAGSLTHQPDHRALRGDAVWSDDVTAPAVPSVEPASRGVNEYGVVDGVNWAGVRKATAGRLAGGDDLADLLVVRWNGDVQLYPNEGGRLGAPTTVGTGWTDAARVTSGDFTADGLDDVVVRWTSGTVFVYPGDNRGALGDSAMLRTRYFFKSATDITAGDLNQDGVTDLLTRQSDGTLLLYPGGTGDPTGLGSAASAAPDGLASGDIDRDGTTDLLVRQVDGSLLLRPGGSGAARVLQAAPASLSVRPMFEVTGDFSGDGRTDLAVRWGHDADRVKVHASPADVIDPAQGTPLPAVTHGSGLFAATQVAAGDLTGDGRSDLVVRWRWGNAELLAGNGDGTFTKRGPVGAAGQWSNTAHLIIGEYTGGGGRDIVEHRRDGSVLLYPGNGTGVLGTASTLRTSGGWSDAVEVVGGDLNDDGNDDLLVRWTAGSVHLFTGDGRSGLDSRIIIRDAADGWSDAVGMTVGDLTGDDGKDDILVRWRAGSAFLYQGLGTGAIGARTEYRPAGALTAASAVLVSGPDMIIKWSDGSTRLYPATPATPATAATAATAATVTVRSFDLGSGVDRFEFGTGGAWTGVTAVRGSAAITPPAGATSMQVVAVDEFGNRSGVATVAVG
jgi:hypothetical protein